MCLASLGTDEQYCRLLLVQRGQILLRLGFVEQALRDMPRFVALADDQQWPFVRVQAMLLQFRLASRIASKPDLHDIADRVRAFGQSGTEVPMNPVFKANALLALAESSLLLGKAADAKTWVEQAFAKLPEGGTSPASVKFMALARELMGIALLCQGKPQEALASLNLAQDSFVEVLGANHAMTQLMALNKALALDALGRTSEALALVLRAEPILQSSLGTTAPALTRIKALRQRLEALQHDSGDIAQRAPSSSADVPEFFS